MLTLAERLAAVRTERSPAPTPMPIAADAETLAGVMGGTLVHGSHGRVVVIERSVALPRSVAARIDERCAPRYFDTETTGLSTGSGTVVFLAAVASIRDGVLLIRQYLLPDYPDEAALLEMVAADLGGGDRIVSYNGRSFDMPLFSGRLRFHALAPVIDTLPGRHDALLHTARRLWSRTIGSVRLAEIERTVLRVRRSSDCPSWEIPARYFAYLRGETPGILREVVDHNAQDVASLVLLEAELARLRTGGWREPSLVDPYGMALELLGAGSTADVLELLEGSADACTDAHDAARLRRLAGRLLVSSGDIAGAERIWRAATGRASVDAATSWVEIARLRERHAGDLPGALDAADAASRALDLALALGRGGGMHEIAKARLIVEKRRRRLARRVAAATRRAAAAERRARTWGRQVA